MKIIGPLEQAVLRAVIGQQGSGYGMTIRREVAEVLGRDVSIGAIYTTLSRLTAKGLVSSRLGEATPERGGRAKTYFEIEASGRRALDRSREQILRTWSLAAAESWQS
jgi:DNA-binding PadR family transcriptional regulator